MPDPQGRALDLVQLIKARDQRAIATALAGLSEPERRALAPTRRLEPSAPWAEIQVFELVLAGTGTLTEIRRAGAWWATALDHEYGLAVLLDRRPAWLANWAEWILTVGSPWPMWPVVHGLVRAGAIERPPGYFDALLALYLDARELGLTEDERWDLLRADGNLRAAEIRGCWWAEVFRELDRARLLDELLAALGRDLPAYRAAWHTKLWKELAVTPEERAERHPALRVLLHAAAEPVVAFAVAELVRDDRPVPPGELANALSARSKSAVRGALRLLDRTPDADVAALALGHADPEVQSAALDRIERWGVTDALSGCLDGLAPTQRPRAEALLGLAAAVPDSHPEPVRRRDFGELRPRLVKACADALENETGLMTWEAGGGSGGPVLVELLDEPLPPIALHLATMSLGSIAPEDHLAAVDLLVVAIADGRADAPGLIAALRKDLYRLMAGRLAKRFTAIAAAGPLHAVVVRDVLRATIDEVAHRPGPLRKLLAELEAQRSIG